MPMTEGRCMRSGRERGCADPTRREYRDRVTCDTRVFFHVLGSWTRGSVFAARVYPQPGSMHLSLGVPARGWVKNRPTQEHRRGPSKLASVMSERPVFRIRAQICTIAKPPRSSAAGRLSSAGRADAMDTLSFRLRSTCLVRKWPPPPAQPATRPGRSATASFQLGWASEQREPSIITSGL